MAIEVSKTSTVIGIKIETQIPINSGDSRTTVPATVTKITKEIIEMRVITITAIEVIITQEEVTDVIFESRGRGRNFQSSDRPPPTYDPNKYCEVCDKTGHMPDECFVVARFQRAKPFLSKHSVQAHKTIEQSTQQNTQPPQSFPPVYPPYPYMYPNPHAYMMHNPPPPTGLPQLTQGQTGVAPQQTQSIPPTQGNTNNSQSNLG